MNQVEIINELNNIAENLIMHKRFQKKLKEVFIKKCINFINNEDTPKGRRNMLEIVKNVSWFHMCDINLFFQSAVCDVLKKAKGYFYLIYEKERPESSNHQIVSSIALNCGVTKKNYIIYNKHLKKLNKENINKSFILIVDDYSGSGETIENIITEIEKTYKENEVYILVYIWQEKAYEKIDKIIHENSLNNKYYIYMDEEETKIEKSYKEKCENHKEVLDLIETVCKKCTSENYRFGYDETGAMISINGVSPNNNISMLWKKDIIYKQMNWMELLNRDLCWEALDIKKSNLMKRGYTLRNRYMANKYINEKLQWEEFLLIVYLFNEYSLNIENLRKIMGYDTQDEIQEKIDKFEREGIIKIYNSTIVQFCDVEIIKELKKIDKMIDDMLIKKKQNKNIA